MINDVSDALGSFGSKHCDVPMPRCVKLRELLAFCEVLFGTGCYLLIRSEFQRQWLWSPHSIRSRL